MRVGGERRLRVGPHLAMGPGDSRGRPREGRPRIPRHAAAGGLRSRRTMSRARIGCTAGITPLRGAPTTMIIGVRSASSPGSSLP
jgi:hypothetical protein